MAKATEAAEKKDKMVELGTKLLTREFIASLSLVEAYSNAISARPLSPMAVAFSMILIEKNITEQTPEWDEIRTFAEEIFDRLDVDALLNESSGPDTVKTNPEKKRGKSVGGVRKKRTKGH